MGIIAIQFQTSNESPLLLAHNREEQISRPTQAPRIQSGRPRVVCGIDKKNGGTWAGVNQHGLYIAVVNCSKRYVPPEPKSRGALCRELLACRTADEALDKAFNELLTGMYPGGHFLCVDRFSGGVAYGGNRIEVEKFRPGLHILTANRLNDPNDARQEFVRRLLTLQRIDSAVTFFAVASRTFSRKPDEFGKRGIIIEEPDYGTVSSILLSLTEKSQRSIMQYAAGPPSERTYEDISALLRQVLSTDRAARNAAAKVAEQAQQPAE